MKPGQNEATDTFCYNYEGRSMFHPQLHFKSKYGHCENVTADDRKNSYVVKPGH